MSRAVQRLVLLLGVLAWGTTALAQEEPYPTLGFKMMNSSQNPFQLSYDGRDPKPAGIDISLVAQALTNAANTWENVPCAYTDFTVVGQRTEVDPNDRFNVAAIWVTSKADPLYDALAGGDPANAIPLTYAGALYQCDIVLNAVDYRWSALSPTSSMPQGYMDLESVLLRELGHCQGLANTQGRDAVMTYYLEPGERRRGLSQTDIDQLCQHAPQAGAVGSPCNATACTNGLTCISTQAPDATTVRVCSKGCTGSSPGECPDPYVCRAGSGVAGATSTCQPPTQAVTQVGKACTELTVSTCGGPVGRSLCREPLDQPSGAEAWVGGYCTQRCGATGEPACPVGSVCGAPGPQVGTERICLKTCRPGRGDCRSGYSCIQRAEGNVCIPDCQSDGDCAANGGSPDFVCRVCDNTCIPRSGAGKPLGELCQADTECGSGLVCLRYLQDEGDGVCARPCSTAACSCPFGSTCQPVGPKGEPLCVSNCTTNSCPSGLLCTPSGEGTACLPPSACENDGDCPFPFACSLSGKCYDPAQLNPDAGTCSLCGGGDGGTVTPVPQPQPTDGGTGGPSGPGGCGCQGAPTSAMAFFAALALLLALKGKRTWHRP